MIQQNIVIKSKKSNYSVSLLCEFKYEIKTWYKLSFFLRSYSWSMRVANMNVSKWNRGIVVTILLYCTSAAFSQGTHKHVCLEIQQKNGNSLTTSGFKQPKNIQRQIYLSFSFV